MAQVKEVVIVKYIGQDGKHYDTEQEAEATYREAENLYNKYLTSRDCKKNLEKYHLTDYGVWRILGEDSNCDFGGSHHNPHLDTVESTLDQAIRHAVTLKGWMTWGHGGEIQKVNIRKL